MKTDNLKGFVSYNENGFWQCDVVNIESGETVWYCTGKEGGSDDEVAEIALDLFSRELNICYVDPEEDDE